MKNSLLLFLFLFSQFCFAQNLVPNPSFEDTVSCPIGGGQVDLATGWSSYGHTPDYCNSCNTSFVGIPSNQWGYQFPRTGNAYVGLICYLTIVPDAREYIGIQLNQSLTIGQEYFVSFYVAMSFNMQGQRFGIATDKIGVRLSTVPYSSNNPIPTTNYAQVYSNSIISDTVNWTKVSGSFVADSAYNYLSIGNFFQDSLTTYVVFDTNAWYSDYYVDDVCLSTDSLTCNPLLETIKENIFNDGITLFPNPTSDILNLSFPTFGDAEVSIFDRLGIRVFSGTVRNQNSLTLNLGAFSPGVYLLKLVSEKDGRVVVRKVVKM